MLVSSCITSSFGRVDRVEDTGVLLRPRLVRIAGHGNPPSRLLRQQTTQAEPPVTRREQAS